MAALNQPENLRPDFLTQIYGLPLDSIIYGYNSNSYDANNKRIFKDEMTSASVVRRQHLGRKRVIFAKSSLP